MRATGLLLSILAGSIGVASADPPLHQVETVAGEQFRGVLSALTETELVVGTTRLPIARVLRWDRREAAKGEERISGSSRPTHRGRSLVLMVAGDRLACDVVEIREEDIVVRWSLPAGRHDWRVPLEHVRAVILDWPRDVKARRRLLARLDRNRQAADMLWLRGGDRLAGELQRMTEATVVLATDAGERHVPRKAVAVVALNPELQVVADRRGQFVRVAFADGSRLTCGRPTGDVRKRLVLAVSLLSAAGGTSGCQVPASAIRSVQYFGGQAVRLSRRPPLQTVHQPFLGNSRPAVVNRSIGGGALVVRNRWTADGLGMSSRTRSTWALDGTRRWFCARVAIDDTAGGGGDVVFRVKLDGRTAWTSGSVTGRDRPQKVGPLDLYGTTRLTLEVDYGRRADVGDHAAWLEPRLVPGSVRKQP